MDQIKEILRQAIKYRFWIAVGVSALLPMIAYFMGVGQVQTQAVAAAGAIKQADDGAKQYAAGVLPNAQYKGIVSEKTEVLTKDVTESHKKLYERQAPLLTWPERVQSRFQTWGRQWPENVDASTVRFAVIDYVNAYPAFVTEVYKSFKPFNPEDGEGVVSAPPEAALLRPAVFNEQTPPDLGKVWAAQERLWIQRTLLDVVAKVNGKAKGWDDAIIKQVDAMEVGNPAAQDQRSIAKGEELEEAPALTDPAKPAEEAAPEAEASSGGGSMAAMMGMMGGSGAANANAEAVFYIKTDSTQFKKMPVEMTILIEQDHIQDFLVGLENSPMNIQVMDFEMSRPQTRVIKPEKGTSMNMGYGSGMMGGMMSGGMMPGMMRGMMGGVSGFGGNTARANQQMMSMMMMQGGMSGGSSAATVKGIDARTKEREKARVDAIATAKKAVQSSLHDPYFNVVEVKIYGQARFFNAPAAETPAESSQSETAATPAEGEKKAETPDAEKKAETPKAEGDAEKKAETPGAGKAETPGAEKKKAETPKAEETKGKGDEPAKDKAGMPKAKTGPDTPAAK